MICCHRPLTLRRGQRRVRLRAVVAITAFGLSIDLAWSGDVELGRYLAAECVSCHTQNVASSSAIPSIAGRPEAQFIAVVKSFKSTERDSTVMKAIVKRLSDEDIAALAAYFASVRIQN